MYFKKKSNEQALNVLLISNDGKSHYVFIKDFNRLMYSKTKQKTLLYVMFKNFYNYRNTK